MSRISGSSTSPSPSKTVGSGSSKPRIASVPAISTSLLSSGSALLAAPAGRGAACCALWSPTMSRPLVGTPPSAPLLVALLAVQAERLVDRHVVHLEQHGILASRGVLVRVPAPVRHHEHVALRPLQPRVVDHGAAATAHDV